MAVAEECFSRGARGQPRLIVCLGESGAGKTRLAREALEAAVDRGFFVAWGTADDTTGTPPHWPWQQVLRSLAANADLVGMAEASGLSAELSRLVPDVFPPPSAKRPLTGSEEDRFRQFDALARLLRDLCRQHAVALAFDDLHWGDEASLLMLRHVVIGLSSERLVLWLNARENDQRYPDLLDELRRGPLVHQLRLSGLSASAVRQQLESMTGGEVTDAQVAGVLALTRGNPFLVVEAARALVEQREGLRGHLVTRGVRNAIASRLHRLSAAAVKGVRAAAVVGQEFDLAVVATMTGADGLALGWVGEAERAGLIEPVGPAGLYRFVHALVRDATEESLDPPERIALHRRAAQAIEGRFGPVGTHVFEIARHWSEAAAGGDRTVAAGWIGRAAELAMRQLAYEDAARLFTHAVRIGGAELDERDRCSLLISAGRAMSRFGALAERRSVCLEAAEIARRRGWVEIFAEAALAQEPVGDPAFDLTTRQLCQEALQLLGPEPSPLIGRLTARFAETFIYLSDIQAAERASHDAVVVAERCGDATALAAALRARQVALAGPAGLEERGQLAEHLIHLGEHGAKPEIELQGRLALIDVCLERGWLARAAAQLDRCQACAEQIGSPLARFNVANTRALLAHAQGRVAEARREGDEAYRAGGWGDYPDPRLRHAALLNTLARHTGADEAVLEANCIGDNRARPPGPMRKAPFISDLASANVLVVAGRLAEAADLWASLGPPSQWLSPPHVEVLSAAFGLEVAAALGRSDDVEALHARLTPYRGRHVACGLGAATYLGPVELWLGRAAHHLGRLDEAILDLSEAERICRESGAGGYQVEATYELAAALLSRGRPGDLGRAGGLLEWVSTEAAALQITTYTAKVDALRDRLVLSSHPLTRREWEIAALISEGLSNRQISDRLFISERTAQNHVQHILTKLGVPNRGQVAVWYERAHGREMSS
jgi:DNA-binding CsgD family transcriptional regulator/tetratricopeptide (TPR) repeat protein